MSIYEEIKNTGVEIGSHESDLYCPVTAATQEIVNRYEFIMSVKTFKDQITGAKWYDIPFAFDPFWINRVK